jgi:hypothetical protein
MADPMPPAAGVGEVDGVRRRNVAALASIWAALGSIVLALIYLQVRGRELLFAVPAAGLSAALLGVIGLARARRLGDGRIEAFTGLIIGIGILALSALVGLAVWALSRSNWQF